METLQKIQSKLDEADIVVVGIGEEFTFSAEDYRNTRVGKRYIEDTGEETIPEVIKALAIRELNCEPYIKAYNNLAKLLDGKTYFINTLNTDDIIFQSILKKERITAPCGSLNRMQCNEACDNNIFPGEHLLNQVYRYWYEAGMPWQDSKPECENCRQEIVPNTIRASCYLEQGYIESWLEYKSWLQKVLDKKVCVLELGVGFAYPEVIRWPLEKMVHLSDKAFYIRVNEKFPQLTKEIHGKGISVKGNSLKILSE